MERFEQFRFSVPAVPLRRGVLCVSVQFNREDGSGSSFPEPLKSKIQKNCLATHFLSDSTIFPTPNLPGSSFPTKQRLKLV